jgi:uroporphyrinogen decarboxylase
MATMTSRERIRAALGHTEPDRTPVALWGSYYTLNDDTYFAMVKHLGLDGPLEPFRHQMPRNSNYYDDRVLDALDTDVRYVWSRFTDLGGARMNGDCRDAWGVEWKRMGPHITSVGAPLEELELEEIEAYPWPGVEQYIDREFVLNRIAEITARYPDRAIGARAVNSYGPLRAGVGPPGPGGLLRRHDLRAGGGGADHPQGDRRHRRGPGILPRRHHRRDRLSRDSRRRLRRGERPDDLTGPLPELLQARPRAHRRLGQSDAPGPAGRLSHRRAVTSIIPDFIEIGIDVLNPLEPLEATDWGAIKKQYGDRLAFMGGVDLKRALTGTPADVERDVQRCIDTFSEGGGYILTSANHMQADIPPENIVHMFSEARARRRG